MQIGPLRHRITIQSLTSSSDPFATPDTWVTVASMWAKISPLSSKEVYQAGQLAMKASHTVTIRYPGSSVTINAGDRILFHNRVFQLQTGIVNPDERNIELNLTAYEIDPQQ